MRRKTFKRTLVSAAVLLAPVGVVLLFRRVRELTERLEKLFDMYTKMTTQVPVR